VSRGAPAVGQTAPVRFEEMMQLSPHGPDTFVGAGPRYPWGGLYGGQIVAQALRAAAATVDPAYRVHSLHAYFIRRGDHSAPIRFEVDRLRDGRSFATRAVVARQSTGAILHMSASFQIEEPTHQVQTAAFPSVAAPDDLHEDGWSDMFQRRPVPGDTGQAAGWLRIVDVDPALSPDPVLSACALAYLSDDLATAAVASLRRASDPGSGAEWNGISLDHAIWFQHPVTAGDWHLYDFRCDGLRHPRGLSIGHVFGADGNHVATVSQEVLLREAR
jgi:acyl-CoA thioesterase-2